MLQHTPEWYKARLGKITGSCVGKIYGRGRGAEFSKTGLSYLNSVAAERLIPDAVLNDPALFDQYLYETSVTSKAMRVGTEREEEARALYEIISGCAVEQTGCLDCPDLPGFASSPDGVIRDTDDPRHIVGALELKCPSPATHMEYISQVKTPSELRTFNPDYFWQCVSHMLVSGADWCDFAVYCPYNVNPLHIIRIPASPEYFDALTPRVEKALEYVSELVCPVAHDLNLPAR